MKEKNDEDMGWGTNSSDIDIGDFDGRFLVKVTYLGPLSGHKLFS